MRYAGRVRTGAAEVEAGSMTVRATATVWKGPPAARVPAEHRLRGIREKPAVGLDWEAEDWRLEEAAAGRLWAGATDFWRSSRHRRFLTSLLSHLPPPASSRHDWPPPPLSPSTAPVLVDKYVRPLYNATLHADQEDREHGKERNDGA